MCVWFGVAAPAILGEADGKKISVPSMHMTGTGDGPDRRKAIFAGAPPPKVFRNQDGEGHTEPVLFEPINNPALGESHCHRVYCLVVFYHLVHCHVVVLTPHVLPRSRLSPRVLPRTCLPPRVLPSSRLPRRVLPRRVLPRRCLPPRILPPSRLPRRLLPRRVLPPSHLPPRVLRLRELQRSCVPARVLPRSRLPPRV